MFADDITHNTPFYSVDDCVKLPTDLDTFYSWCSVSGLSISVKNCSQIYFLEENRN